MVVLFYERVIKVIQAIQVFDVVSINEDLEKEFYKFFHSNNLDSLFTNEHRSTPIKVTDNDLRAVVNDGGAYHEPLKEFASYLSMANDNKSYEEAVFRILYNARSFQGLMNNIKKHMKYIDEIIEDRKFNSWNIVWYDKQLQ